MANHSSELSSSKPALDVSTALVRLNGNIVLYRKLLVVFRGRYKDQAIDPENLLATLENGEARLFVHSMKGAAGNIAAHRIHERAEELETYLARGEMNPDLLRTTAQRLNADLADALAEVDQFLASIES